MARSAKAEGTYLRSAGNADPSLLKEAGVYPVNTAVAASARLVAIIAITAVATLVVF